MAPMAEITTPALRRCIRKFDKETILCSEMLSGAALARGSVHNEPLTMINEDDEPFVFQILGGDPAMMAEGCAILSEKKCSGIDINMGCSAPDIIKKFQGSRLLADMDLTREIVRRCRKAYNGTLSVKMRSGFEQSESKYLLDFALMLEGEGVDYITLHPRHGKLSFRRTADWSLVRLLKENINIPVVGNGDISSPEDVQRRFNETGCDGIMIGRNAVVSPWIFALSRKLMNQDRSGLEVDLPDIFKEVLLGIKKDLPEHLHKSRGHRFSFYFSKNFVFSHEIFKKIRNVDDIDLMIEIIDEYVTRNPGERTRVFKYNMELKDGNSALTSP